MRQSDRKSHVQKANLKQINFIILSRSRIKCVCVLKIGEESVRERGRGERDTVIER